MNPLGCAQHTAQAGAASSSSSSSTRHGVGGLPSRCSPQQRSSGGGGGPQRRRDALPTRHQRCVPAAAAEVAPVASAAAPSQQQQQQQQLLPHHVQEPWQQHGDQLGAPLQRHAGGVHAQLHQQLGDHEQQQQDQQQQQQQQQLQRPRRDRLSNSWQWIASQLELSSAAASGPSDNLLGATARHLLLLAQPGVAPTAGAEPHQQLQFAAFLGRLLLTLQQQLQQELALQQQQQQWQRTARTGSVSRILWALSKLELQPAWQQQQQQAWPPRSPHPSHQVQQQLAQATQQVQQRAAAVVSSAAQLLLHHLSQTQRLLQRQQKQQSEAEQPPPWQLQRHLHHVWPPRVLAQSLWGLARLQFPCSGAPQLLPTMLRVVQLQLPGCSGQDLANVIWAVQQLRHAPDEAWTRAFLDAAAAAIARGAGGGCNGQAAAVMLLSLAELGEAPPAAWVQGVLDSMLPAEQHWRQQQQDAHGWHWQQDWQQQQQQQQQDGQQQDWRQQDWRQRQPSPLQQMDGQALASVLGALAKWGRPPRRRWLLRFQQAALRQLHRCSGRDAAQLLWALATLAGAAAAPAAAAGPAGSAGRSVVLAGGQHNTATEQQQQQEQGEEDGAVLVLLTELLHGLMARLADRLDCSDPRQVVLGLWATTKLHQLTEPAWGTQQQQQQQHEGEEQGALDGQQQDARQRQEALQQQQQRQAVQQHWRLCHGLLLHCLSQLPGVMQGGLSCYDCALLAWALVMAGGTSAAAGDAPTGSSQGPSGRAPGTAPWQQRQRRRPWGSSSSSSSSTAVSFPLPDRLLQQLLACSKPALPAGDPHSQALLLAALAHLQVPGPPWQWLLGFYEASEPRLAACSARDLSMMAAALVRLGAKPLSSWQAAFLAASRRLAEAAGGPAGAAQLLPPSCLVTLVWAAASPGWGLAAGAGVAAAATRGAPPAAVSGAVPGAWTAAVQAHMLQLLPQMSSGEVCVLVAAAGRLGWCCGGADDGSGGGSSSSLRSVRALLDGGLLACQRQEQQRRCRHRLSGQQQEAGAPAPTPALAAAEHVRGIVQLLSAAATLPAGAVPQQWWAAGVLQLWQQLQRLDSTVHDARHRNPQGQQPQLQEGGAQNELRVPLASLSSTQLNEAITSLLCTLQVLQEQEQQVAASSSSSSSGDMLNSSLFGCLKLLLSAAAARSHHLKLQHVLVLLRAAARLQTHMWRQRHHPTHHERDQERPPLAAVSSSSSNSQAGDGSASLAFVHELVQVLQPILLQRLPTMRLQQLAEAMDGATRCRLLLPAAAAAAAAPTPAAAGGGGHEGLPAAVGSAALLRAVLAAVEQQLLQLEAVSVQDVQLRPVGQQQQQRRQQQQPADPLLQALSRQRQQQPRQQQQQPVLLPPPLPALLPASVPLSSTSSSDEDSSSCGRDGAAAPHMVRLLVAFARCSYRPPARLLRQMLRVTAAGMHGLLPQQLLALASSAAVLQLGSMCSPAFAEGLWGALLAALPEPQGHWWRQPRQQQQQMPAGAARLELPLIVRPQPPGAAAGTRPGSSSSSWSGGGDGSAARAAADALSSSSWGSGGGSSGGAQRVLLVATALHRIATAQVLATHSSRRPQGPGWAGAYARSCGSRIAVGRTPDRRLVGRLFEVAADAAEQLLLPQHSLRLLPAAAQAQQRAAQRELLLPLLRLLGPLACYVGAPVLRAFTLRVVARLVVLQGRDKTQAWKAVHRMLLCWRAGRQRRLGSRGAAAARPHRDPHCGARATWRLLRAHAVHEGRPPAAAGGRGAAVQATRQQRQPGAEERMGPASHRTGSSQGRPRVPPASSSSSSSRVAEDVVVAAAAAAAAAPQTATAPIAGGSSSSSSEGGMHVEVLHMQPLRQQWATAVPTTTTTDRMLRPASTQQQAVALG